MEEEGNASCQDWGGGCSSQTQNPKARRRAVNHPPPPQPRQPLSGWWQPLSPSQHCCPLSGSCPGSQHMQERHGLDPAALPQSRALAVGRSRHLRGGSGCGTPAARGARGVCPRVPSSAGPKPSAPGVLAAGIAEGQGRGVQDLEGGGALVGAPTSVSPAPPLSNSLGRQKPAGCRDASPWHPSARTQTWR